MTMQSKRENTTMEFIIKALCLGGLTCALSYAACLLGAKGQPRIPPQQIDFLKRYGHE